MKHKLLAVLLVLAMALSLLPTAALAAEPVNGGTLPTESDIGRADGSVNFSNAFLQPAEASMWSLRVTD